jgi:hypothetical protein
MNRLALTIGSILAFATFAYAGTEYSGKEMKQVAAPAPCPEWYGDTEWNVALWGAYAFDSSHDESLTATSTPSGSSFHLDRGFIDDHAFGGGMDFKYFFHRYFGVGIEGFALSPDRDDLPPQVVSLGFHNNDDWIGAVKGTITLRYPIGCTRFAPYIYGGGGVMFGRDKQDLIRQPNESLVHRDDSDPRAVGEVGGGVEIRITRHIGWINDVSWNFTDNENFGMVRGGINFAF